MAEKYRYEVGMPRHQYWVVEIWAESGKQALEKAKALEDYHPGDLLQEYLITCSPGQTRNVILNNPKKEARNK